MREYSYYFAQKSILSLDALPANATFTPGLIFFGIRAQDLLLKNDSFYKKLGFFTQNEITSFSTGEDPEVSSLILSKTSNAQRLSIIKKVTFTIIPIDSARTLNPYNDKYNTGVPYSTLLSRATITQVLKEARFTFSRGEENYVYRIEANSIKEKRQKKTAPSYS